MITKSTLLALPKETQNRFSNAIINGALKTLSIISLKPEYKMISSDGYDYAKDELYTIEEIIKKVGLQNVNYAHEVKETERLSIAEKILTEIQELLRMKVEIEDMTSLNKIEALIDRNVVAQFNLEVENQLNTTEQS